jgi:hypothetical protein
MSIGSRRVMGAIRISMDQGYFSAKGFGGIALRVVAYPKVWEPDFSFAMDSFGEEYEYDTGNGEWVENPDSGRVLVCMVGDNRKYELDREDLTPLAREEFCGECGQIGCAHDGLDRDE